jgi:hypothetical protein
MIILNSAEIAIWHNYDPFSYLSLHISLKRIGIVRVKISTVTFNEEKKIYPTQKIKLKASN